MLYQVARPHYFARPMRFGSRGLSEFPGRCRQITVTYFKAPNLTKMP